MDKEEIRQIVENKDKIIALKKAQIKHADGVFIKDLSALKTLKKKEVNATTSQRDQIQVIAVINTTNLFDSHRDVHIDGLWTK